MFKLEQSLALPLRHLVNPVRLGVGAGVAVAGIALTVAQLMAGA
ncbi:hypothetical protein [Novosphingobium soli]|uniref:Uncharacterized protein n=1 Tax=Novosphingobium soli TaxID=574956 RepID=A0ABV6CR35_9SPHN